MIHVAVGHAKVKTPVRPACSRVLLAAMALVGLVVTGARAANYYVDVDWTGTQSGTTNQPYKTIKAAVDAANLIAGPHNIYIAAGWYGDVANGGTEDYSAGGSGDGGINLSQRIYLYGGYAGWDGGTGFNWNTRTPRASIVDLTGAGSRAFRSSLSVQSQIAAGFDGITFQHANHTANGGAIIASHAGGYGRVAVNDCLFTNNVTTGAGGALYTDIAFEPVTITSSDFMENQAANGGAVRTGNNSVRVTVDGCVFRGNTATASGGAFFFNGSNGWQQDVRRCLFENNTAGTAGGAVFTDDPRVVMDRCTFVSNAAPTGAAVGGNTYWCGAFYLQNCLVVGNTGGYALYVQGYRLFHTYSLDVVHCTVIDNPGGGIYCQDDSGTRPGRVLNSIVVNNGGYGIRRGTDEYILANNDVFGHSVSNYYRCEPDAGSISTDPGFADAVGGDYRLAIDSPCIDSGTNVAVAIDRDGVPRPMRFGYDIGCYEEWQMPVISNRTPMVDSTSAFVRAEFAYESTSIVTYAWLVIDVSDQGTNLSDWGASSNSGPQSQGGIFGATFGGLLSGTTYWFRCIASNSYDVWAGPAGSFNTPSGGGATRVWTGAGGNRLASNTNNWQNGLAPGSGDYVLLDGSSSNMTWDAGTNGLPDTVARWTQTENYTGLVTFTTVYPGQGAFTNFAITGDALIARGAWNQVTNPAGATAVHWLHVTVGGDFTIETPAIINVNGLGFRGNYGPGNPVTTYGGAGHGGYGGQPETAGGIGASGAIYGSVAGPDTLGSGGGRGDLPNSAGGGAVILVVAGDAVVDGTITADGVFAGDTNGSGGSVNLVARTLSGAGSFRANGGTGSYDGSGGGRVAVRLTQFGADFGSFSGSMIAYGGLRTQGGPTGGSSGAAGTVYRQTGSQTDGQGTLIIDNGNREPYLTGICTVMPAGVNLNDFVQIVLTNKGNLGVSATDTLSLAPGRIVGAGPNNAYVTLMSTAGVTFPNPYTIAGYTLVANTPISAAGDWTIAASGGMTHGENDRTNESFKIDLTLAGNLTIDGTINVNRRGYRGGYGPGKPTHSYAGPSYGGRGGYGHGGSTLANVGAVYGSVISPTNVGSGGGRADGPTRAGGGAVILAVSGNLAVNGSIRSESESIADTVGSGGSINITAGTISGSGPISVNAAAQYTGGGGGRIAVKLTQPGASFAGYTGAMTAYGGNAGTALYDGAAGTIYRSGPDVPATVTIANFVGASTASGVVTVVNSPDELRTTTVVITNDSRLAVTTNAYFGDLYLTTTNSVLDLNYVYRVRVGTGRHALGPGYVINHEENLLWVSGTVITLR